MKRFAFRLGVAVLSFLVGLQVFAVFEWIKGSPDLNELSLVLSSRSNVVQAGDSPVLQAYITNNSRHTVTLVQPGDGSGHAIRTPVVQWSIVEAGDSISDGLDPEFQDRIRMCGNINSLKWKEVFRLRPGETQELEVWIPDFRTPGNYVIRYFYANRPSKEWGGIELGMHNPLAMWRVKHSTEVTLASNEISLTVAP